jgi:hypothetical protein
VIVAAMKVVTRDGLVAAKHLSGDHRAALMKTSQSRRNISRSSQPLPRRRSDSGKTLR